MNLIKHFAKPRVLDGGFTTELQAMGTKIESGSALWSSKFLLDQPEIAIPVHKRFLDAGATVLMTNTYKCCIRNLVRYNNISEEAAPEIGHRAVRVARQAIEEWKNEQRPSGDQKEIVLAGAIGPYSGVFAKEITAREKPNHHEYGGAYVEEEGVEQKMTDYHYEQAAMLHSAGCDILAFETIPALLEAESCLKALERLPDARAWIAFSCKDKISVSHGELFSDAVDLCMSHPQVLSVGVNCSNPAFVSNLLQSAQPSYRNYRKPFVVYPNSGEMYQYHNGWSGDRTEHSGWEHFVREWHALGARIIGGCCRVYSSDIADIADTVRHLK